MYAVVETGGKQYKVEKGTTLLVDRLSADEGAKVDLRPVAFNDKELVVGQDLEKVKVEAKVAGHERGPKIRVFKYRAKKLQRERAHEVFSFSQRDQRTCVREARRRTISESVMSARIPKSVRTCTKPFGFVALKRPPICIVARSGSSMTILRSL